MLEVSKVAKFYSLNGVEVQDPPELPKGIEINGEMLREGQKVRVFVAEPEGQAYEGDIVKITGKNFTVEDEFYIGHVIPYEQLHGDKEIEVVEK